MTEWITIVRAVEGGALLVCIWVLYKVLLKVITNSKEDRDAFLAIMQNDINHLTAAIDKLSDRLPK